MLSKTCTKCKSESPFSEFRKSRRSPDGLHAWCRKCTNEAAAEYRKNRSEDFRAALKRWRESHKDQDRDYAARYRPVRHHMARGKRFGAADGFTLQEYEKMVSESGGVCFYCGGKGKLETDHKIPLCRGGSNHISNICLACVSCNRRKARMTADEFWSSGKMGATDDAVPALNESG